MVRDIRDLILTVVIAVHLTRCPNRRVHGADCVQAREAGVLETVALACWLVASNLALAVLTREEADALGEDEVLTVSALGDCNILGVVNIESVVV